MDQSISTTTWDLSNIFSDNISERSLAVVTLNRDLRLPRSFYSKLWSNSIYKTAADGGANHLRKLNISESFPDLSLDSVIGDLDSVQPETRKYWEDKGALIIHDPGQDTTDLVKAIEHIWCHVFQRPIDIVILGDIGGRVDHGLSVLHNLYKLQKLCYESGRLYLLSSESITFLLQSGNHVLAAVQSINDVSLGRHVGIIPLKEPSIISTCGLEWDVRDWETKIGGQISTSNHIKSSPVSIQTSKDVLFTINLKIANNSQF